MSIVAEPAPTPKTHDELEAARQFFQKHGYLYIKNFFDEEEVRGVREWTDMLGIRAQEILAESIETGIPLEKMMEQDPNVPVIVPEKARKDQVCRIEDYITPALSGKHMCYPDKVRDFMTALFGETYALFKEKINFKWPGGGAFPHHQDYPAYGFLAPKTHATAMLTIDPATTENGCLQVALDWTASMSGCDGIDMDKLSTGTAVIPFCEGGAENGSIKPDYVKKFTWAEVHTTPDQLLIFSSFLPHYSLVNSCNKARRAMFLTHNRLSEGEQRKFYYDKKRNDPNNPMFHIATPTQHSAM
jgi:2-aminoethylphosphonate dioxygenase